MDFIQDLIINNAEIYIVGGTNRDKLLNDIHKYNIKSYDYDLLVRKLDINALINILRKYGDVKEVGKSFGVIAFKCNNVEYDIALPRKEISTGPGYKDFDIVSDKDINIEVDLERRDATINAIAIRIYSLSELYNHDSNKSIIDPFNGLSDINNKLWRAVGDPFKRFIEDPTRIMRALRQCSQFNLELEKDTRIAILQHTDLLKIMLGNSSVRITEELVRLLNSNYPEKWIDFIINISDIGKLLELNKYNNISNLLKMAVDLNLPIEERVFMVLFNCIDNYKHIENWIKNFSLSAAPHFPSEMVKFILLSKKYYNLISEINDDLDMRWFIIKMGNYNYSKKIIQLYKIINNMNVDRLDALLENNKNTILSVDQVNINGTELMNLYNIKGKQIGIVKSLIFNEIINDNIKNDKDDILNYLSLKMNDLEL